MIHGSIRSVVVLTLSAIALGVVSCGGGSGGGKAAPISAVTDHEAHSKTRIRAIESLWDQVAANEIDHATARESLKKVAWSRSTFWEIRMAALQQLVADEAHIDDTRNMIGLMLPTETHWEVIGYFSDLAVERRWKSLAPALVRSWSRPPVVEPSDADRPE